MPFAHNSCCVEPKKTRHPVIAKIMNPLYWLMAMLLTAPSLPGAETGLYDIFDVTHPKPFLEAIGRVTLTSQANDNSRYHLAIAASPFFSLPCSRIGLVVGDRTIRFYSQGMEEGRYHSMDTMIDDPAIVPQLAERFQATVYKRRHPGYLMLVRFLPEKAEFGAAEPVTVKLRITNVGQVVFAFFAGGRQRGGTRNNQFAFTAQLEGGVMLSDSGDPHHRGGLAISHALKPGESFEETVDLTKWFKFEQAGTYEVRGSYYLRFADLVMKEPGFGWEDFASAEFAVRIINKR